MSNLKNKKTDFKKYFRHHSAELLKLFFIFFGIILFWHISLYSFLLFPKGNFLLARFFTGLILSLLCITLVFLLTKNHNEKGVFSFLSAKNIGRPFLIGIAWFLIPASLALLIAVSFGFLEISLMINWLNLLSYIGILIMLVFLSEALPEEILFRGYFYKIFSQSNKIWITIFGQAFLFLVFAFFIGAVGDLLDASFLLTFALVLGLLRAFYKSVLAPIGFHLCCMVFQQLFNTSPNIIKVNQPELLQVFILGMIPLSITMAYLITKMLKLNTLNSLDKGTEK